MKKYISEQIISESDMSEDEIRTKIRQTKSSFDNDVLDVSQYVSNITSLYRKLLQKCDDRDSDIASYNCKISVYNSKINDVSLASRKCSEHRDPESCRERVNDKLYDLRQKRDNLEYPTEE